MINVSQGELVFNTPEERLDSAVRAALEEAAAAILRVYERESVDLASVTTKTNPKLAFAKFVRLCTLRRAGVRFGEGYVKGAFKAYSGAWRVRLEVQDFYAVTLGEPDGPYCYRPSFSAFIRAGLAFFLVALHRKGHITLPYSFTWPTLRDHKKHRLDVSTHVGSELMQLVRSVVHEAPEFAAALEFVRTDAVRRTWFLLEGTKLLLALGWNVPEDVNLEDLLKFKEADDATRFSKRTGMAYRALVHVLERRYGDRVAISVAEWDAELKSGERRAASTRRLLGSKDSPELVDAYSLRPSDAFPERLAQLSSLPGLQADFQALSSVWLSLETVFVEHLRRESLKDHRRSLGHWNLYLLFYLPYWFQQNPTTALRFPSSPSELVRSVFVSRVVPLDCDAPLTYLEFLKNYGRHVGWQSNDVQYISLKALEQFFHFLERHEAELPGCAGFRQPLSKQDFPPVPRQGGTNKRPIPRRLFAFYVSYVEALVAYMQVVIAKTVSGEIGQGELVPFLPNRSVVDTLRHAHIVGYVPMVFFKGKRHVLQFIPNCMDVETFTLKDGRTLRIPQPHGLHNVLVALYTGLRNNHIQWLDARTFDGKVHPDDVDCTRLWVNTDKRKKTGWAPYVNMRVIEILRQQLAWRQLIDCVGFAQLHFYMDNSKTKWPQILPLFSSSSDGLPHPDTRYSTAWSRVLCGVQGIVRELDMTSVSLVRLLPSSVRLDASDIEKQLKEFSTSTAAYISVEAKSDITPHSARVGVVSNLIHVLPADIIGKFITGQTERVVYHYVHIEPGEALEAQKMQAAALQVRSFGREFSGFTQDTSASNPRFIKADAVNSRFADALKRDVPATIESYGCISLTLTEEGKSGIDVLNETRGSNAAFNKTELCPFGNHCPPEIIKLLRGMRKCAMCPYAVRSIDHLPAVLAKGRQVSEQIEVLEAKLDDSELEEKFSSEEVQQFEAERQLLATDWTAWTLVSEILEAQRSRIASGMDDRRWVVPKPAIIEQALRRVAVPSGDVAYVIARLQESVAYPTFDSPAIASRFDLLRRQLLANVGKVREALTSVSTNVTMECVGLLRTVVDAHGLTYDQVVKMLSTDEHLLSVLSAKPLLLES